MIIFRSNQSRSYGKGEHVLLSPECCEIMSTNIGQSHICPLFSEPQTAGDTRIYPHQDSVKAAERMNLSSVAQQHSPEYYIGKQAVAEPRWVKKFGWHPEHLAGS